MAWAMYSLGKYLDPLGWADGSLPSPVVLFAQVGLYPKSCLKPFSDSGQSPGSPNRQLQGPLLPSFDKWLFPK